MGALTRTGRRITGFDVLAAHESAGDEALVAEFALVGTALATGETYRLRYVHVYEFRGDQIAALRDYWNPAELMVLDGSRHAYRATAVT